MCSPLCIPATPLCVYRTAIADRWRAETGGTSRRETGMVSSQKKFFEKYRGDTPKPPSHVTIYGGSFLKLYFRPELTICKLPLTRLRQPSVSVGVLPCSMGCRTDGFYFVLLSGIESAVIHLETQPSGSTTIE